MARFWRYCYYILGFSDRRHGQFIKALATLNQVEIHMYRAGIKYNKLAMWQHYSYIASM